MSALPIPVVQTWQVEAKTKPGFYVSAIEGRRRALPAGPFKTHAEALAAVDPTRKEWEDDPRAHFAAWGTARVPGLGFPPGGPCTCDPPCERM